MAAQTEKNREAKLRYQAKRLGYRIERDRARSIGLGHLGGWRVTDDQARGRVVAGRSYELSLSDVAELLDAREATLAKREMTP